MRSIGRLAVTAKPSQPFTTTEEKWDETPIEPIKYNTAVPVGPFKTFYEFKRAYLAAKCDGRGKDLPMVKAAFEAGKRSHGDHRQSELVPPPKF